MERIKAEAAEAANRELKEMQKKNEQMMEEKEKSYREHVKQLTEKMQQEQEELKAEREKILLLKLKVPGCTILIFRFCSPINNIYQEPEALDSG